MIARLRAHRGDAIRAVFALAALAIVTVATQVPPAALDTYSASDVRSGGYAAWQELLEREGVAVEQFRHRPIELDGTIDTLIDAYGVAPVPDDVRFTPDVQALVAWVRRGGRLLIIGGAHALGAREAADLRRPPERRVKVDTSPFDASPFGDAIDSVTTYSSERFRIASNAKRTRALLSDDQGALIVRVGIGRGAVVYVTDPRIFENAAIAKSDNARLAYLLARPRRAGRIVAFDEALHGALIERGWLGTLGVPMRIGLGGIALALIAALAGSALRLGPPVTLRAVREPASDEFIAAVASLYRRARARAHAITLLGLTPPAKPADADLIAAAVTAYTRRKDQR